MCLRNCVVVGNPAHPCENFLRQQRGQISLEGASTIHNSDQEQRSTIPILHKLGYPASIRRYQ